MSARHGIALITAVLMVAALPVLAATGDVDPAYGTGGYIEIPDDGGPHWIGAMAARPSGESILTGSAIGGGSGEQAFWVAEVAADGSGFTDATDIVLGAPFELGTAIFLNSDGTFLVAGEIGGLAGVDTDMFAAKFNADLTLYPGYSDSDPVTPDGTYVYNRTGTERVTSVFADGADTVVGGYDDGPGSDALVWRLLADASPDPAFGTSGLATLPWTGLPVLSAVETHVHPGLGGDYLAIGIGLDAAGWIATMSVDATGTASVPTILTEFATEYADSAAIASGGAVVASASFSPFDGHVLNVIKVAADGTLAWMASDGVVLGTTTGATISELRDGTIAVVSAIPVGGDGYRVTHYAADGILLGTIVDEADSNTLLGSTLGWALASVATDGGLLVTSVLEPATTSSIDGALAVTRFFGDESGRFVDDDGSVHEANIEAVEARSITSGCDADNAALYCPEDPLTRAQMASLLVAGASIPPAPDLGPFVDDDGNLHEPNIAAIAAAGVTLGCDATDPTLYCPEDEVTRDQMASFLVRAFGLDDPMFAPADPDPFTDDDGSVHEANIAIIAGLGITLGCDAGDPTLFCPTDPVTRGQIASFIERTLLVLGL